ncbi:MAG: sulfatase-like hydrolase/transferase [Phycisphaeraceae bacterium]|nr:sulfatase-like hydrolase/transferase [Phycisphaeraceae bacterium]
MDCGRNLIIVAAHGLRADVAGDTLSWPFVAPNLESLSNRGVRLVARSACPADPGGMVSLLTGMHARQHGVLGAGRMADLKVAHGWPRWLTEAGYHTAGVGCVGMLGDELAQRQEVADISQTETDQCAYLKAMWQKGYLSAVLQQRRQRNRFGPFEPQRLMLEPADDIDGFISREAEAMLRTMPEDHPWALIVNFSGPGNDMPPPGLYDQLVDLKELEAGFMPPDFRGLNAYAELDYPRVLLQRLDPLKLARIRGDYLGRVSLLDHGVGRLTARLSERKDRDRTWVVVCSDRGQLLGERGLIGHRSFLAGAVEVPVILTPPLGSKIGTEDDFKRAEVEVGLDGVISTVDVAATIAALGSCDRPSCHNGRSLAGVLFGHGIEDGGSRVGSVSEFGNRLMLETEQHKVVFDTEVQEPMALFDLLNDSDERQNLLETLAGANVIDSLRWRLADALMPIRAGERVNVPKAACPG